MRKRYRVAWEKELDADTPVDAAKAVERCLASPMFQPHDQIYTVWEISDPYSKRGERIDLAELGYTAESAVEKLIKRIRKLEATLAPFAKFARNVDANGWTSSIHREPISYWFGPSDFRNARETLLKGHWDD